jgi:hypothetical protein
MQNHQAGLSGFALNNFQTCRHRCLKLRTVIVYRGLEPRFCKNRLDKSYSLWYCRVDESGQAIERQS